MDNRNRTEILIYLMAPSYSEKNNIVNGVLLRKPHEYRQQKQKIVTSIRIIYSSIRRLPFLDNQRLFYNKLFYIYL